jgi:nucleotide-binding universal stress UspA family protein
VVATRRTGRSPRRRQSTPGAPGAAFRLILVPTDFSPPAEAALATAVRLARAMDATLLLLHVAVEAPLYSEGPFAGPRVRDVFRSAAEWAHRQLAAVAARVRADGVDVRAEVRQGAAPAEIVARARTARADVIVIGTQGRGGVERTLLGSVADRVVRTAPCPVLTVRGRA